jgi:hypothetical protein
LVQIQSAARFSFQLTLKGIEDMPIYPSDKPDFDAQVAIDGVDSEGFPVKNIPVPAGFTLAVVSDNTDAFTVTQDTIDARLLHCHVGGPNPDGTPANANVVATLTDPANNVVSIGAAMVTVQAGSVVTITGIALNLPEA